MSDRSRHFKLLLYPDEECHRDFLNCLWKIPNWLYVGILHDGELKEDGSMGKPHWHIILSVPNARSLRGMQKELGRYDIDQRFVRMIPTAHDLHESRLYLLHRNVPLKKQYDVADLFGNNVVSITDPEVDDSTTEEQQVLALMELLRGINRSLYVREFLRLVCDAELFSVCRRMGVWSIRLLEEHNQSFSDKYHE